MEFNSSSFFEVEKIQNKQRVLRLNHQNPIRFLVPKESELYTALYLSGYGGGIIQGDYVLIDLTIGAHCKLALTTQSYTKAFKSDQGKAALQKTFGHLKENATLVSLPDPLIPQGNSDLILEQEWDLSPGAKMISLDWYNAGRAGYENSFAYKNLSTDFKIIYEGKPVVWDHQVNEPEEMRMDYPSRFGTQLCSLNGYLIDYSQSNQFEKDIEFIRKHLELSTIGKGKEMIFKNLGNIEILEPGLASFKFMAKELRDFLPIIHVLQTLASHEHWLGQKPFQRKF